MSPDNDNRNPKYAKAARRQELAFEIVKGDMATLTGDDLLDVRKVNFTDRGYEWFMVVVVVNTETESELVAFHSGDSILGILTGFRHKCRRNLVKWKVNAPFTKA